MNNHIPKIIHYCWLSSDSIPDQFIRYIETWKKHLPDYEFKLWNFEIFDKKSSLWVSQAFDAKKYAFAADYIRLYALYHFGGIYMDMDVELLKPFDDLLNRDLFIGYESLKTKNLEAGVFGASKENYFIGECLKHYENRQFIKKNGTYDMLPLPQIITPIYKKLRSETPFSPDFFTAKSLETGEIETSENTYSVHHFSGSWTIPIRKKYMSLRSNLAKKTGIKVAKLLLLPLQVVVVIKEDGFSSLMRKITKGKK